MRARRQIADHRIKTEARFDQQAKAQLDLSWIQRQAEKDRPARADRTLSYELKRPRSVSRISTSTSTRVCASSRHRLPPPLPIHRARRPPLPSAIPAKESQEYEAALNQFKAGKYKDAAAGFAAFIRRNASSSLAPMPSTGWATPGTPSATAKRAIEAQSVVTTKYADSPKAPDAWLAMATCQQEMGSAGPPALAGEPDRQVPECPGC